MKVTIVPRAADAGSYDPPDPSCDAAAAFALLEDFGRFPGSPAAAGPAAGLGSTPSSTGESPRRTEPRNGSLGVLGIKVPRIFGSGAAEDVLPAVVGLLALAALALAGLGIVWYVIWFVRRSRPGTA